MFVASCAVIDYVGTNFQDQSDYAVSLLAVDRERQSLSLEGVVSSEGTMPLDLLTTREGAYMLI